MGAALALEAGDTVEIHGLQNNGWLINGQRGRLLEWLEYDNRWRVKLKTGYKISAKVSNLKRCEVSSSSEDVNYYVTAAWSIASIMTGFLLYVGFYDELGNTDLGEKVFFGGAGAVTLLIIIMCIAQCLARNGYGCGILTTRDI